MVRKVVNPWKAVSWKRRFAIVNGIKEENLLKMHRLCVKHVEFDHLPEPYSGWKDSIVLCLNMNPGQGDPCLLTNSTLHKSVEALSQKNLKHSLNYSFWEHSALRCTAGARWLARITKELRRALGFSPRLFMIEFFPYHSVSGFPFPSSLPSYEYRDCLVKEAIEQKKWIVVMRAAERWLDAVCDLKDYPYLMFLNSSRNVVLSSKNLVFSKPSLFPGKTAFGELVSALRDQQRHMAPIP